MKTCSALAKLMPKTRIGMIAGFLTALAMPIGAFSDAQAAITPRPPQPLWDGALGGRIGLIEVFPSGQLGFRVTFQGSPQICNNGGTFGYLEPSDTNYQVYVAALLSAFSLGKNVSLYTTRQANGHCYIGAVGVN